MSCITLILAIYLNEQSKFCYVTLHVKNIKLSFFSEASLPLSLALLPSSPPHCHYRSPTPPSILGVGSKPFYCYGGDRTTPFEGGLATPKPTKEMADHLSDGGDGRVEVRVAMRLLRREKKLDYIYYSLFSWSVF